MAGDSNKITREYFDRLLIATRYIDSELPTTEVELFGRKFATPIGTSALSHLEGCHEKGTAELAKGAKLADAINFVGMESYEGEIDDIAAAGAATVRIIKPHEKNEDVIARINKAKELGVFAVGMDIDHAYNGNGGYDVVCGLPMKPKSLADMKSFVKAAGDLPFIVKGVLSVEDAVKCVKMGAAGIVISHHHGIMPYSVPPLMVLPEIKEAVGDKLKIFLDCGVESGVDVYKALALGADAVLVGRALMGPLKENAAQGVATKIKEMNGELMAIMARTGFKTVAEMDESCLYEL